MTIIFIIVSLSYLAVIVFLAITWYKDLKQKEDTDKRILVLEKRIQEQYSDIINDYKDKIINLNIEQSDLEKRVGKLERKHISKNS